MLRLRSLTVLRRAIREKATPPKPRSRWLILHPATIGSGLFAPTPSLKPTPQLTSSKNAASKKSARWSTPKTISCGAGNADRRLHLEAFAEVKLPTDRVVNEEI